MGFYLLALSLSSIWFSEGFCGQASSTMKAGLFSVKPKDSRIHGQSVVFCLLSANLSLQFCIMLPKKTWKRVVILLFNEKLCKIFLFFFWSKLWKFIHSFSWTILSANTVEAICAAQAVLCFKHKVSTTNHVIRMQIVKTSIWLHIRHRARAAGHRQLCSGWG